MKHEWYAAGHPPLPSFELASFQAQMPVHWKPLAAKPNFAFREGSIARDDSAIAANLGSLRAAGVTASAAHRIDLPTHPNRAFWPLLAAVLTGVVAFGVAGVLKRRPMGTPA